MRQFIEAMAAANGGVPNVKGWMAAHRPARWNAQWEDVLPSQELPGVTSSFTITNPTAASDLLYPGPDQYVANRPLIPWTPTTGAFSIDTAVVLTFQQYLEFPEHVTASDPTAYGATHAMNCWTGHRAYGYPTYWFDSATVNQYTGGVGFASTQDVMDEKALNCTPYGMFAAFCAWDGGQLMTAEVSDFITGNTVSPVYLGACERGGTCQNGKLAPGQSRCGGAANDLITYADGASPCFAYYYPDNNTDYDGSSRVAAPGRMPADRISINPGDEPWMDMIGNLHEAVLKAGETQRFDYRGYGNEYTSIDYHTNQETTARMKGAAFGARCMRFK